MRKLYIALTVILAAALIVIVCTIGTGGKKAEPSASPTPTAQPSETDAPAPSAPTVTSSPTPTPTSAPTPTPTPEPTPTPSIRIRVYTPASGGFGFVSSDAEIDSLSAQNVADALYKAGALDNGLTASSSGLSDDKYRGKVISVDLGSSFASMLNSRGDEGKYLLIGCVVNTYIAAYGAQSVRVTCGGSSMPEEYSDYMTAFSDGYAPPVTATPELTGTTAENIVSIAKSLIGTPYQYGGNGPDYFDNSGFVWYCYRQQSIDIPRTSYDQFAGGTEIAESELLPGDLVFFTYSDDRSASYVGIYLGGGQFIAENNEDSPVCIHDMTTGYFTEKYVGARRYS